MSEPTPDPAELRAKVADGIPPSLIDSPAVGVGAARRLQLADAMLAAVEYAGYVIATPDRLLPADAEIRTEYGVRLTWDDGSVTEDECGQHVAEARVRFHAERRVAVAGWRVTAEQIERHVTTATGPWLPAPTTEESA